MQDLVTSCAGQFMRVSDRQLGGNREIDLSVEPMPDPTHPNIAHAFDPARMRCGMTDLLYDSRIDAIQHAQEDRLRR